MSYVLIGALGPIMPYRLDELEIGLSWVTPLTATWLVARVGCVLSHVEAALLARSMGHPRDWRERC